MDNNNIFIAGANLYKVTFQIGNELSEKIIVANNAGQVEELFPKFIEIQLMENDISMIVLDEVIPSR